MLTSQLTRSRTFRLSGNISRIAGRQAIGDREKSSEGKVKHIGARPFIQFFLLRGEKKSVFIPSCTMETKGCIT